MSKETVKMLRTETVGSGSYGPTVKYAAGRKYPVEPGVAERLRASGAAEEARARSKAAAKPGGEPEA